MTPKSAEPEEWGSEVMVIMMLLKVAYSQHPLLFLRGVWCYAAWRQATTVSFPSVPHTLPRTLSNLKV